MRDTEEWKQATAWSWRKSPICLLSFHYQGGMRLRVGQVRDAKRGKKYLCKFTLQGQINRGLIASVASRPVPCKNSSGL